MNTIIRWGGGQKLVQRLKTDIADYWVKKVRWHANFISGWWSTQYAVRDPTYPTTTSTTTIKKSSEVRFLCMILETFRFNRMNIEMSVSIIFGKKNSRPNNGLHVVKILIVIFALVLLYCSITYKTEHLTIVRLRYYIGGGILYY